MWYNMIDKLFLIRGDFHEKNLIDQLIDKGAISIEHPYLKPNHSFYYANNARCEIESIAQHIIKNKQDFCKKC